MTFVNLLKICGVFLKLKIKLKIQRERIPRCKQRGIFNRRGVTLLFPFKWPVKPAGFLASGGSQGSFDLERKAGAGRIGLAYTLV